MCGRYVSSSPAAVLADYFEVDEVVAEPDGPSFNVAPTDPVPAVARSRDGHRRLGMMRWGLHSKASMINARAETVLSKPAFGRARRRCIIPADGFYEWERPSRQPWFIHRADGAPLAMAGLWARSGGVTTCTIITTAANDTIRRLHDRMPVLLDPADWTAWLEPDTDPVPFLRSADPRLLELRPVSRLVNSIRNNGPELLQLAAEAR